MSLEKEFVPYEEALTLKELGFDEPCLFAFDNCNTPMRCSDLRTNEQKFNGVNYNNSTYTSQPTFSQAFRWFREKCFLFGYPFPNDYQNYGYRIVEMTSDENKELVYDWGTKDTYEEAELACLRKLIEIVKQK